MCNFAGFGIILLTFCTDIVAFHMVLFHMALFRHTRDKDGEPQHAHAKDYTLLSVLCQNRV